MVWLLTMLALFAACRPGGADVILPTATATATPLSTALPEIATAVPAGLPANPLQMLVRPVSSTMLVMAEMTPEVTAEADANVNEALSTANTEAERLLEEALLNASSVTVDIVPVERPAEALSALCASAEKVSAVWVEGVAFSAALAQNCGEPIYVVERRVDGKLQTGESGVIVLNSALNSVQMSTLRDKVFCRLNISDFYSWLLPLMVFRINNINQVDFASISEFKDSEKMLKAVASGDCAGAGLSKVVFDQILADNAGLEDQLAVVYTSPEIPYPVLMYPVEMQLGIRLSLTDGLEELAKSDSADLLRPFLGQDGLKRVDLEDFADYSDFLAQLGLDFSILGN